MATSYEKFPLGTEDMLLDVNGNGQVESVPTSGGGNRNVHRIGARDIYASTTLREKKYADGTTVSAGNDLTVDKVLQQVLDDLEDLGQPDGVTLENAAGALRIKDEGVDSDHYIDGSIDNAHLAANSVDSDQYVDGSIDPEHLADNAVTPAKLATNSVTTDAIAALQVDTSELANNAVTPAKTNFDGSGGTFTDFIVDAGIITLSSAGGSAQTAALVGETSDTLIVTPHSVWTSGNELLSAEITAQNIVTVRCSNVIPSGAKLYYCVLRTVA
jgi:hypothetical protein